MDIDKYLMEMERILKMKSDSFTAAMKVMQEYQNFFESIYRDGYNDGVNVSIKEVQPKL